MATCSPCLFFGHRAKSDSEAGSHLSSDGSYRSWIGHDNLCRRLPNTRHADWKVPKERQDFKHRPLIGRVAVIDLQDVGNVTDEPIKNSLELSQCLQRRRDGDRRLLILESLDPKYVGALGEYFRIDPSVFPRHQRTALWEFGHRRGNTPSLASSSHSNLSFMMEYSELRQFYGEDESPSNIKSQSNPFPDMSARSAADFRHIGVTRVNRVVQRVGMLHRKATYWAKRYGKDGWDVLLIVDPPLPKARPGSNCEVILVGNSSKCTEKLVYSEPYHGGYLDFLPVEDARHAAQSNSINTGPPRTSLFDDLRFYWENHASEAGVCNEPISATFFLQKIIASEYNLLTEYLRGALRETEWYIQNKVSKTLEASVLEGAWGDSQSWTQRCGEYTDFLDDILEGRRGIESKLHLSPHASKWSECCKDFESIQTRLRKLNERAADLASAYNALAGMVNNRQATMEAQRVRVLTILATFFVPLSFVTSLFSIAAPYGPGYQKFWIAYTTGLALTAGVMSSAALLYSGFNDEGHWLLSECFVNVCRLLKFTWLKRIYIGWETVPQKLNEKS